MNEPVPRAQADAARAYEELFVPALFAQWAPRVAGAAQIGPGQRVLDVACGTGVLAREIAARVGSSGHVIGIDAAPGMVAVAGQLSSQVEWRHGFAESLPFAGDAFDAVVSQFGLMFFKDRIQALREMRRVLSPSGRLVVAVWDSVDNIPAYASVVSLLEQTAGREAADALRAPFVLGGRGDLRTLFSEAGMDAVDIATHQGTARFPGIRAMVEAELRGWLPIAGVVLGHGQIDAIVKRAEQVLGPYAAADGRVTFAVSAHLITATKL